MKVHAIMCGVPILIEDLVRSVPGPPGYSPFWSEGSNTISGRFIDFRPHYASLVFTDRLGPMAANVSRLYLYDGNTIAHVDGCVYSLEHASSLDCTEVSFSFLLADKEVSYQRDVVYANGDGMVCDNYPGAKCYMVADDVMTDGSTLYAIYDNKVLPLPALPWHQKIISKIGREFREYLAF